MDRNDPRLIVTLVAVNPAAERAWNRQENQDRCEPAPELDGGDVDIPSRGTTPAGTGEGASKIHLTFDKKPKNLEKGFVFGSDPKTCDVLLGPWAAGFTRQHFRITFNARGDVILTDISQEVTRVSYDGEDLPTRNDFTWILFYDYENITITLNKAKDEEKNKKKNQLVFRVEWPENRKFCKLEYQAHRDAYLEECRKATPSISRLGIESKVSVVSPIYLKKEELGRGSFGTVHKVVNVSTAGEYAGKTFHGGNWKDEVKILETISHVSVVDDP